MKLSTTLDLPGRRHGEEDGIRKIAAAGFDAFDLSLFRMFTDPDNYAMNRDEYRAHARRLRAVADECGIVCNQSHAPFSSSKGDPVDDARRFSLIVRAMEIASIVGAENIVVHPMQHLCYHDEGNPEKLEEMNMSFYQKLIPYCEEFGVHVAVENMWQYHKGMNRIWHSTCSTPAEFCRYIDRLNSPWIVACLDVGHVSLVDEDADAFIRRLGNRLKCLHVHDTDFKNDLHTLPFFGMMDFDAICRGLAAIGYNGDITFEADSFFTLTPLNDTEHQLAVMHAVGRDLIRRIEEYR